MRSTMNTRHSGVVAGSRKRSAAVVALLAMLQGTALANPVGPQVINGQASFSSVGNTLSITNSPNTIINWNSFSINQGELTRFIQQSPASIVLNRVTGGNASAIYGALQSNGKVFLINQNGILFGPGAQVDVNGLMASTLDIRNDDFLAGRFKFFSGVKAAGIENQGRITSPTGGNIYLIAPDITNSGIITAPGGDIVLAAGHSVSLVDSGSPDMAAVVSAPEDRALNLGQIIALAGRIGIYGGIIAQKGIVSATSAVADTSGRIFFKATKGVTLDKGSVTSASGPKGGEITVQSGEAGTTLVSGTIEATGTSGTGGSVRLLGQHVGLINQGNVDASGASGGGTVLVGGDYQGKNPGIRNAQAAYVGKDTVIKADATGNGNGGKVIVWSDDETRAYGTISARGGANGGNGGFVETSGHWLDVNGIRVSTAAPKGKNGLWLLDPTNIYIAADQATATGAGMSGTDISVDTSAPPNFQTGGAPPDSLLLTSTLQNALVSNSVQVSTSSIGGGAGDINVVSPVSWASANSLTLLANNDIAVNAPINYSGSGSAGLTLAAGRAIVVNQPIASTAGTLNVTLNAHASSDTNLGSVTILNNITTNGGNLVVGGGLDPTVTAASGYGTASNDQLYGIYIDNNAVISTAGGAITMHGKGVDNSTQDADGIAFWSGQIHGGGGNILLAGQAGSNASNATTGVYLADVMDTTGTGTITVQGTGNVAAATHSRGVNIVGATLSTDSGTLTVTGTGGSGGANNHTGVLITSGTLQSTGGNIVVTGIAGDAASTGITNGGTISGANNVTLNAGTGTFSQTSSTAQTKTTGVASTVDIKADSISLGSPTFIGTGTNGRVIIEPVTPGRSIQIDAVRAAGTLGLLSSDFAQINTGTIQLGNTTAGNITISTTFSTPGELSLFSSGAVTQSAGSLIQTPMLQVTAADINLPEANSAGVVSGRLTSAAGNFIYRTNASAPLSVSTVDGISGIWASSGGSIKLMSDAAGIGISQNPGSSIQTPGGLALITNGSINLTDPGNAVGALAADLSTGTGSMSYAQSSNLTIGTVLGTSGIIAPNNTVSLASGGTVTQVPTAPITAMNLAVKALGNVDLSLAANSVANLAASLGDVSNLNRNFTFRNGAANLNIGFNINGMNGISTQLDTTGYDPANQNGKISLITAGTLTQSPNAFLAGKAVYAEGASVGLTQNNPTGIIAGKATGLAGVFAYTSQNGIQASNVNGNLGISAPAGIRLTSTTNGIGQDMNAPLTTSGGLVLTAAGPVGLGNSANSVGSITASLTGNGDLMFYNATPLTVIDPGIATSGKVMLSAPSITIDALGGNADISGIEVMLQTNQAEGTITMSGTGGTPSITATNSAQLETDNFTRNSGTITVSAPTGDISIHPFTAGRSITVGDSICNNFPCLLIQDASLAAFNSPVLVIGNDASGNSGGSGNPGPLSGDIFIGAAGIDRSARTGGTLALLSGGNVSQAGGITIDNLGVKAIGTVNLSGANSVKTLADKSASLTFNNNAILTIGTVSGGVPPNDQSLSGVSTNGDVLISSPLGLRISSPIQAGSGAVTLAANSGSILSLNGPGVLDISGTSLSMTSYNGIGAQANPLDTKVSTLAATTLMGGDIAITNTAPLTITLLSNTGTGGRIGIDNTGAVTTTGPIEADSDISLTAHSPLTIGTGGVTSATGNIALTAGATGAGATGDDLTLNGPLSGTDVTLKAGNAIVENSTIAARGIVSKTPNLNKPPLPTIGQCISTPTLAGCSLVLPSVDACTATPKLAGCSVVLPTLAACTATPSLPGCSVVLPTQQAVQDSLPSDVAAPKDIVNQPTAPPPIIAAAPSDSGASQPAPQAASGAASSQGPQAEGSDSTSNDQQTAQAGGEQNGQPAKPDDKKDDDKDKKGKDTTQKSIAEKRDEIRKNKQYCN